MIIVIKPDATEKQVQGIVRAIEEKGLKAHLSKGDQVTIIGAVGDKSLLSARNLEIAPGVEKIVPVTESYKLTNKKFHPQDSVIPVGNSPVSYTHLDVYKRQAFLFPSWFLHPHDSVRTYPNTSFKEKAA